MESQILRESPSVLSAFGSEQADDLRLADIEEVDEEQVQDAVEVPDSLRLSQFVNRAAESTASIKTVVSETSSDDSNQSDSEELLSRPAEVDEAEAEPEVEEVDDHQSLEQDEAHDEECDETCQEAEENGVDDDHDEAEQEENNEEIVEAAIEHDEGEQADEEADEESEVHESEKEDIDASPGDHGNEHADVPPQADVKLRMIDEQAVAELVMQDVDKIYGDSASDEEGDEVATYILPDQVCVCCTTCCYFPFLTPLFASCGHRSRTSTTLLLPSRKSKWRRRTALRRTNTS